MNNAHQNRLEYKLAEIHIHYSTNVEKEQRFTVGSPEEAYQAFMFFWDKDRLEYKEFFYMMVLNQANEALGVHLLSVGGRASAIVDIAQLLAVALKANGTAIILGHNHPSKNMTPPTADIKLTKEIQVAATTVKINLLDHLIISSSEYASFSKLGLLHDEYSRE